MRNLDRALAAAIPICGLLDATAIFNFAGFGIPIAWALTAILIFRLWHDREALPQVYAANINLRLCLNASLCFTALLWSISAIHTFVRGEDAQANLFQCISRTSTPIFMVAATTFLALTKTNRQAWNSLLAFGCLYVVYGLYDLAAQIAGMPRFLEFLRNSNSIHIAHEITGWTGTPRVASLASEPSTTSIPLIVFASAIISKMKIEWLRAFLLVLCVIFVIATFARTLWLVIIGTMAACLLMKMLLSLKKTDANRIASAGLFVIALWLPILMLVVRVGLGGEDIDYSVAERQESTRAGYESFLAHPIVGSSFTALENNYRIYSSYLSHFLTAPAAIHNALATYMANLGIFGYIMFSIPLVMIVILHNLPALWKCFWLSTFILVAQGHDMMYFPSFWTALIFVYLQAEVVRSQSQINMTPQLTSRLI
jgi:ABC-type multidrug transport system fused ATPase/permease subunit